VVQREEFEAVKEMARLAREENEALQERIVALEASAESKPAKAPDKTPAKAPNKPPKKPKSAPESD